MASNIYQPLLFRFSHHRETEARGRRWGGDAKKVGGVGGREAGVPVELGGLARVGQVSDRVGW
jgi:hypothetical protein